jgi:hypothetical protein
MVAGSGNDRRPAPARGGESPGWLITDGSSDGGGRKRLPIGMETERRADVIARLLVVEDDWFIGMDIEDAAQNAGYEVVGVVTTADEAVAQAFPPSPISCSWISARGTP